MPSLINSRFFTIRHRQNSRRKPFFGSLWSSELVNVSPGYSLVHIFANQLLCWSRIATWYLYRTNKSKRTYCAQYIHISTDTDDTIMTACSVFGLRFRKTYRMKSDRCCQVGRTSVTVAGVTAVLVGTATIALVVDLLQTPLRFLWSGDDDGVPLDSRKTV